MRSRVLVFPCGSEIGLEIHRSVQFSTHFELVGASSVEDHGRFVFNHYIGGVPHIDGVDFLGAIKRIVEEHDIDYIFPAHDSVVWKLSNARATGELACPVITSPARTCDITRSKLRTYRSLANVVPTPKLFNIDEISSSDLPIFLKPEVGQGSKGVVVAHSVAEARAALERDPSLLVMELLPGSEFTVDCFTNRKGRLLFSQGRERQRTTNGISVRSARRVDDRFQDMAEAINRTLEFRAVWFFQVKERSDGELVLMEVAPRVAGTMGLSRCYGANLPLLSLFDAQDLDVSVFENQGELIVDRALGSAYQSSLIYDHVYLDFDDLVVEQGKVNPLMMAFVFQCLNRGVQLHLLTRHSGDLAASLKQYRLDHLFVDTVKIGRGDPKHAFITEAPAIFIDDSYAERKAVHDALGIPVFDAHMLEGLLEPL